MKLKELLKGIDIERFSGRNGIGIRGLVCDSKKVGPGDLFIALKGTKFDGHDFIEEATQRGAVCIIEEARGIKAEVPGIVSSVPGLPRANARAGKCPWPAESKRQGRQVTSIVWVEDTRKVLSQLCKNFYSKSIEDMRLVGVTGTNGKTTITYLLESILKASGRECGVIGTINYRFLDRIIPATNTTPGILDIYNLLEQMKKNNVDYCVLEVSSHSLDQGRVDGLLFDAGIFTNLTPEHLDYHRTLEDYLNSKIKLFKQVKDKGYSIINIDDPSSEKVIGQIKQMSSTFLTYGIRNKSDVVAEDISQTLSGADFTINFSGKRLRVRSSLIGLHNVYNILAAFCCAISLRIEVSKVIEGIQKLSVIPGRLEKIDCGQDFLVFIDYAHTGDSLENSLLSLKRLCKKRLIVVFGCGGDRDRTKRPFMGKVATELCDRAFITSDNPRSEDPEAIASEIVMDIAQDKKNYEVIIDRERAIKAAIFEAATGDFLLIAGKGHERFQIFKDRIIPLDDREVVKKLLKERLKWQILKSRRF